MQYVTDSCQEFCNEDLQCMSESRENGLRPTFYAEDDDFLVLKIKTIDLFSKIEFFYKAQPMGMTENGEGGTAGRPWQSCVLLQGALQYW